MAIGVWYTVNGTFVGGSWVSIYSGGFEWQIVSQDIVNNTSTIKVRQWIRKSSTSYNMFNLYDRTSYYSIAGVQYNFTSRIDLRTTTGILANIKYYMEDDGVALAFPKCITKTVTITHNADGTKTVPITTFLNANDTSDHFTTMTATSTVTLDTIPRASTTNTPLALNIDTGANTSLTVAINRASSSFTHDVVLNYQQSVGVWVNCAQHLDATTSATLAITLDATIKTMCDLYPNTKSIPMQLVITTKSGTTTIGTSTYTGTGTITNANPTLTLAATPYVDNNTSAIYGASSNQTIQTLIGATTPQTLLQKVSALRVTTGTATKNATKGATTTFVSYRVRIGAESVTVVSTASTGVVIDVSSNYIDFVADTLIYVDVIDSRGNVGTYNLTIKVAPYSAPNVSLINAYRNNNYDAQSYLDVTYDVQSIINSTQKNASVIRFRTKNNTSGVWTSYTTITNPTAVTGSRLVYTKLTQSLSTLDQTTSHTVEISQRDYITTTYVIAPLATISKGTPLVRWKEAIVEFGVEVTLPSGSGITGVGTGISNTGVFEINESNGTTRQGWFGKGSAATNDISVTNNIVNGDVALIPNGTGIAKVGTDEIWHKGNLIPSASGNRWGVLPQVESNGVMEIGKYVDFHETDAAATDYDGRLECSGGLPFWSSFAMARIIGSGSSGTNHWVKYSDGTLIKYGTFTLTVAINVTWGSIYTTAAQTLTFNSTIPFTTVPAVKLDIAHASAYTVWHANEGMSTATYKFQLCRGSTLASAAFTISYMAIGRG